MKRDVPDDHTTDDWVESALQSRPAMTAPVTFTAAVMGRLPPPALPALSQATPWIEDLGRAGLAFAVLGAVSVVDVRRLAEWSGRTWTEPASIIMAAVLLLTAGIWYPASSADAEPLD